MRYLFSNLTASRVNLLQNDFAAGMPSPLAFMGLAGFIAGKVGFGHFEARVMPILYSVTPSEGRIRPEYQFQTDKSAKGFAPVEIPESMRGHVEFGFLLDLPGLVDIAMLQNALKKARLAGGIIFAKNGKDTFDIRSVPEGGAGLRMSPRGRAVIPGIRDDLRHLTCWTETHEFEQVQDALAQRSTEDNPTPGMRVPAAIGYRLLTLPGQNPNPTYVRDPGVPHVFAEPGTGVAELVSVRNTALADLDEDAFSERMWSWSISGRHVVAHSVYLPSQQAEA
ncbi:hypothetical protein [Paracoccus sp. ME4]|uniref:hypothetical protein n=1 Tax=Paracoccus sp. ME4 TaxID=3138066 RepID=UPI00398AE4EE